MTNFPTRCSLLPGLFPMDASARRSFDAWRAGGHACGNTALHERLAHARNIRIRLDLSQEEFRQIGGLHGFAAQVARKEAAIAAARSAGVEPHLLAQAETNPLALLALPQRMVAIEVQKCTGGIGGVMCPFGPLENEGDFLAKMNAGILHAIRTWTRMDETLPFSLPSVWAETSPELLTAIVQAAGDLRSEAGVLATPLHIDADAGWMRHIGAIADEGGPAPTAFVVHSGAIAITEEAPANGDNDAFAFLALLQALTRSSAAVRAAALVADLDISCRAPKRLLAAAGLPPTWRLGMRIHNPSLTTVRPTVSLRFAREERPAGLRLRFIEA